MNKQRCEDLVILGGQPLFPGPLHVGRPGLGDRARLFQRIEDVLDSRWLTNNGPYVCELEAAIAERLGVRNCIAVCNGTVGLEIAARATGLSGEVLVPSFTFVATAHSLLWQGMQPVFCDIDPTTHNIDPVAVERSITERTTGILGVHLWGRPCDIDALTAVAATHDLVLLFDAAHAFDCGYQGRMIGNFGDAEVFSFHATKFFNTGEGGAIVTNNDELAQRMRLMTKFGFAGYDNVVSIGINGKMSEFSAALGLTNLESIDQFTEANREHHEQYKHGFHHIPGISLTCYEQTGRCNHQYVVIEVDAQEFGMTRDELMEILHSENILARRYFYPGCHRSEPYRNMPKCTPRELPATEALLERVLCLPTGTAVGPEDVVRICELTSFLAEHAGVLRTKLDDGRVRPRLSRQGRPSFMSFGGEPERDDVS